MQISKKLIPEECWSRNNRNIKKVEEGFEETVCKRMLDTTSLAHYILFPCKIFNILFGLFDFLFQLHFSLDKVTFNA